MKRSALLVLAVVGLAPLATAQLTDGPLAIQVGPRPNILVVLVDDLGVDALTAYKALLNPTWDPNGCAFADSLPCLPNLQRLVDRGLSFTDAWTNPSCSPTRAALLTGRYGFRYGLGAPIAKNSGTSLPNSEVLIPEVIGGLYDCAAFGKWHLTDKTTYGLPGAQGYPWDNGFDHFEGQLHQVVQPYCNSTGPVTWTEILANPAPGPGTPQTSYLVQEHVQDAISWIQSAKEPWFCYLAPQAPYELHQWPPGQLGCTTVPANETCNKITNAAVKQQGYDTTLEAFDAYLGQLLDQLDILAGPNREWSDTTTVFFIGDNGTPESVVRKPFGSGKAKESIFEGGVRVPFIIAGKRVHPSRWGLGTSELVNTVDVFATVASLAGVLQSTGTDSVNLRPYLKANPSTGLRSYVYAEYWPNQKGACYKGGSQPDRVLRSNICGAEWKIHYADTIQNSVFYDLSTDPCELNGLAWNGTDPVMLCLRDEMLALLATCP